MGISLERKRHKRERMRRSVVIGNVEQYPTQDLALAAVNGLRVSINEACNRQRQRSVLIGDLVDHLHKQLLLIRAPHHLQLGGRQTPRHHLISYGFPLPLPLPLPFVFAFSAGFGT